MKILSARLLKPGKAHVNDWQKIGWFDVGSSFILPPSSLLFKPQVRKPLGRVNFSSHCVGQEKLR